MKFLAHLFQYGLALAGAVVLAAWLALAFLMARSLFGGAPLSLPHLTFTSGSSNWVNLSYAVVVTHALWLCALSGCVALSNLREWARAKINYHPTLD